MALRPLCDRNQAHSSVKANHQTLSGSTYVVPDEFPVYAMLDPLTAPAPTIQLYWRAPVNPRQLACLFGRFRNETDLEDARPQFTSNKKPPSIRIVSDSIQHGTRFEAVGRAQKILEINPPKAPHRCEEKSAQFDQSATHWRRSPHRRTLVRSAERWE